MKNFKYKLGEEVVFTNLGHTKDWKLVVLFPVVRIKMRRLTYTESARGITITRYYDFDAVDGNVWASSSKKGYLQENEFVNINEVEYVNIKIPDAVYTKYVLKEITREEMLNEQV